MVLVQTLRTLAVTALVGLLTPAAWANLVQNGDFAEWAGGKPAGWEVVDSGQKAAKDTAEGRPSALRVEVVKEVGGTLGEIRQTVKVQKNQKYRLSADLKSTKGGQALVMIKLRTGRKEGERLTTDRAGAQWATVTKEFESGGADNVQILCRFSQKADAVGATHWFTNVTLVALDAEGKPIPSAPAKEQKAAAPKAAKAAAAPVAAPGSDQYVLPQAAGSGSGADWANARGAAGLQAAIDAAGPGNTVHIGSGTYEKQSLKVAAGGSGPEAVKTIAGKDTGAGLPVFRSDFDKASPAKTGSTLLTVASGVGHVAIRDLKVEGHRQAVALQGRHRNLRIVNVDVTASRDAFWVDGGAAAGEADSGSSDLVFEDCDVTHFTKRAIRVFGGNRQVEVKNCRADAGGKEWATEPFAVCFQVIGGKGGIIDREIAFTDCVAANAYHDGGEKYWNADGFCTERAAADVTFTRCQAYNNTDGGWDVKSRRSKFVDCVAVGNKRNYRIWSGTEQVVMTNCLSAFSVDRGKLGHDAGFWVRQGTNLRAERCTSWGDQKSLSVENHYNSPETTTVVLDRCLLAAAAGGKAVTVTENTKVSAEQTQTGGVEQFKLAAPRADWRGGDGAFDCVSHAGVGYRKP